MSEYPNTLVFGSYCLFPENQSIMRHPTIECVPNFSEGRDLEIIRKICDEIETVEGVKLLNIDPGYSTNRTVVTFAGNPEAVCEAAFRAMRKAGELIDMSKHSGDHPRMGATDVCPLVPLNDISMEETAEYARKLAERVGTELGIPVYCYEAAAFDEKRRNLAYCRQGEYEGLKDRISSDERKPDFGPTVFNERVARTGATAVGARDFLVAVNFNLNTTSTRRANAIAFDVREKGRAKREGNPITGKIMKDANGEAITIPGSLKATKAIGWYIEEYGIAQVSMNINDISITPLHVAFDEVCRKANERGIRVTGTEIVGLVPKKVLIDAGKYFLAKQQRSSGIPESEIIDMAIVSLGLSDLKPFKPDEKVIEYLSEDKNTDRLIDMSCRAFSYKTASESPAPGGGSTAAYVGALGAALGTMVANLSAHKAGWDERWAKFSIYAERGQKLCDDLLRLVDEDTAAFKRIMVALDMPKSDDAEKNARKLALSEAVKQAIEVPLQTMQKAVEVFAICKAMVETGNPNSVSDAAVGAVCARAATVGAYLNVKINAAGLDDKTFAELATTRADEMRRQAENAENEILIKTMEIIEK